MLPGTERNLEKIAALLPQLLTALETLNSRICADRLLGWDDDCETGPQVTVGDVLADVKRLERRIGVTETYMDQRIRNHSTRIFELEKKIPDQY